MNARKAESEKQELQETLLRLKTGTVLVEAFRSAGVPDTDVPRLVATLAVLIEATENFVGVLEGANRDILNRTNEVLDYSLCQKEEGTNNENQKGV